MSEKIAELEREVFEKQQLLAQLKRDREPEPVDDYELSGPNGMVRLSNLFGDKSDLIVVHNMGKSCPYCTLWGDNYNGAVAHLNNRAAFVVVSPDTPDIQQEFAAERGWRFGMYSGAKGTFIEDMGFKGDSGWMPGVSTFWRDDDGNIFRVASAPFGPYDAFCSAWHFFSLLKGGPGDWAPKYSY